MIRTHDAGSLRAADAGTTVTLAGWVARRRDHGGVIFVDLRDASGVVQVVFREEDAHALRNEFCVKVTGEVTRRPEGNENPELPTGEIEVTATELEVLSEAAPLPLPGRRPDRGRRRHPAASTATWTCAAAARRTRCGCARGPTRSPGGVLHERDFLRDRDADADPVHARGRPRLPGAGAAAARHLVRAAAVAAAVQAAADGRRHGAVLPDRPLLPRRGLPRRPAAGVHPARHRDVLRHRGRRHRPRRGDRRARCGGSWPATRSPGRSRASPGTTRWPATAPTSPTCATAWS